MDTAASPCWEGRRVPWLNPHPVSRRNPAMAGKPDSLKPETLAANALGCIDEKTGAIVPAIHPSTTYLRDADNSYSSTGRAYSRAYNPPYDQVEALLNQLEGGQGALVFSSGMAAATALFMSLKPGDHVVAPSVM